MSLSVELHKKLGSFSLDVAFDTDREVLALLGASGSGKSLTLRCIAGILTPDSGKIVLNGRTLYDSAARINLPPQKRHMGYLFQQYALFPNMTVAQNLRCGAGKTGRDKVPEMMRAFHLEGLEERFPKALSGGQQQRVALCRILLTEPEVLLLDEPFSALDEYLKWQVELELTDLLSAFSGDVVYVSHSRDEVYRLCSSVCVLEQGKSDPKCQMHDLFRAPQSVGAALISGCKNLSRAEKTGDKQVYCADWGVTLHAGSPVSEQVNFVGIRAHYLKQNTGENVISCRVSRVIDNVFSTILMLKTPGGGELRMEVPKEQAASLRETQMLEVSIAPEDVMLLRQKGDYAG